MTLLSSVLGDAAVTDALRVTLLMFRTEELLRPRAAVEVKQNGWA